MASHMASQAEAKPTLAHAKEQVHTTNDEVRQNIEQQVKEHAQRMAQLEEGVKHVGSQLAAVNQQGPVHVVVQQGQQLAQQAQELLHHAQEVVQLKEQQMRLERCGKCLVVCVLLQVLFAFVRWVGAEVIYGVLSSR